MKNKHEEILTNFWNTIANADGEDFGSKMTGYCLIYAPYMICMLESDDSDYHTFVLQTLRESQGKGIHEQIWCLYSTEEVPKRAFDNFMVKSYPQSQSNAEIRQLPQQVEKVSKIYHSMLNIGTTVRAVMSDPSKGKANIDSTYQ